MAIKALNERQDILDARTRKDHVFYKLINTHKSRLRQCITELTVNESACKTEDEIQNGWR